jgi:hypothetical protein
MPESHDLETAALDSQACHAARVHRGRGATYVMTLSLEKRCPSFSFLVRK